MVAVRPTVAGMMGRGAWPETGRIPNDLAPGIRIPRLTHESTCLAFAASRFFSHCIGLMQFSVECSRVLLYQAGQAMISSLALRLVAKRRPYNRSTFGDPDSVSLHASTHHLPLMFAA